MSCCCCPAACNSQSFELPCCHPIPHLPPRAALPACLQSFRREERECAGEQQQRQQWDGSPPPGYDDDPEAEWQVGSGVALVVCVQGCTCRFPLLTPLLLHDSCLQRRLAAENSGGEEDGDGWGG